MRVLDILELLASNPNPLTVSDITCILGYPKTSIFDIVNILSKRGFIRCDNERAKTYVIGPVAYRVGMSYLAKNDLYSISHPILTSLRDSLGETCYLAIEESGYIIYLDKVESSQPIRSTCNIGARNFMYLTGLGKALLAAMPEDKIKEIAARGLPPRTDATITDTEALLEEMRKIRNRGCAYDMGEDNSYVRCVAAPIRDRDGLPVAAISVSMLDVKFTEEMKNRATREIIDSAEKISRGLGWSGNKLY